ncbi:MAG: type III-B CRISPR module RAMP protein Cmr1, partial [Gammaproteobacteria bacterium]
MPTMTVTLRTATPLFLGGAATTRIGRDEVIESEVRVPPIKSALRFWFRFVEGARQHGDWKKVKLEEDRLFGSSESGVGSFRIKLKSPLPSVTRLSSVPPNYDEWPLPIMYLGYGCVKLRRFTDADKEGRRKKRLPTTVFQPARPFIDVGQNLSFEITLNRVARDADLQKLYESIWLWTHLGGFGSRSRRGWGSLQLVEPRQGFAPAPVDEKDLTTLKSEIENGITGMLSGTIPSDARFTHWFSGCRIVAPRIESDWEKAMTWLGSKMITFRSNYRDNRPPKTKSYPPCWSDHDLVRNYLLTAAGGYVKPTSPPKRAVFGLPQNYGFFSLSNGPNAQNPSKATITARWKVSAPG